MGSLARPELMDAVSPRTGLVRRLVEIAYHHDDPQVYCFAAEVSDTTAFSSHQCTTRSGGAGLSRQSAMGSAIGEAIERYCCNFYDKTKLPLGCYEDFSSQAVDPATWTLFSEGQYSSSGFPFRPFTTQTVLRWVEAECMTSGGTKLLPAHLTYLPYAADAEEQTLCQTISTGLACRGSKTEATLYALYECIERDAFAIYWLNGISRSRVAPLDVLDEGFLNRFVRHFVRQGIEYHIWDVSTDIPVPSYFCVAIGASNIGQLLTVGSASHLDSQTAIMKTLTEAAQGRSYLRYEYNRDPHWSCKDDFSDVNGFEDHAQVYSRRPELL
jgi:ribosomal protein S12 methylthiotransferase accessory factor